MLVFLTSIFQHHCLRLRVGGLAAAESAGFP